ncbi:MAG: hypothetical protein SW833_01225 [Cyanobacteriota bacterium]|nr:hypothetical protein [Cyanobacteriota bacterium]
MLQRCENVGSGLISDTGEVSAMEAGLGTGGVAGKEEEGLAFKTGLGTGGVAIAEEFSSFEAALEPVGVSANGGVPLFAS